MKSAYFTTHLGKNPPPQNDCQFKSTGFTSSTFPIQPDFLEKQPAVITLNTGSPQTLLSRVWFLQATILHSVKEVFGHI
jgi:hypothetical protein